MNDQFWSKVDKSGGPDACWLWTASKNVKNGEPTYGFFTPSGEKRTYAHRYSYREQHGSIPDGLFVCHRCNNPACVNPAHLYAADNATNIRDAYRDGLLVPYDRRKPNCPTCGSDYYTSPSGQRRCRKCDNQSYRVRQQRGLLTPREAQVLEMTRQGLTAGEIASQMGITAKSVGNFQTSIKRKEGMKP